MNIKRLLIFLFVVLLLVNLSLLYPYLTGESISEYEIEMINVTRIVDGDTIESTAGKIRLKGINCPEKNQLYSEEATEYLKQFQGKEIALEKTGKDRYNRELGYLHYQGKLINLEILKNGFGHLYYYEQDKYFSDMKKAEKYARDNEKGIWRKSKNYGCIELINLEYNDPEGSKNQEQLILKNKCNKNLNIIIKDDATHIYEFSIDKNSLFIKNFTKIWNDNGDTLYVWDDFGLLLWERY